MLNILKMDLYKMFKSKNFYIVNVILILVVISLGLLLNFVSNMDYEDAQKGSINLSVNNNEIDADNTSLKEKDYYTMQEELKENMDVKEFLSMQYSSGLASILIVIFIALFVCSEWDSGFIKNIIPLKNSRTSLLLSKNVIIAMFIIIQAIIALISAMISSFIITGKFNNFDFKELMIYMGIQIIIRIAFSSLLILISYMFKSKSTSMSIGILFALNIHGLFLTLVNKVVSIGKLDISKLSLIGNTSIMEFAIGDYKRIIIISIVYFLLYNIVSTVRIKKMEIS